MAGGYTGKILRLDLTNRQVLSIDTSDYEEWGGGHGIASAIFWDLAVKPGDWDMLNGFDPRNIITLMPGPLGGTLAPSAGRTEVQSVGVYPYPVDWWTRSNLGGRFAGMLKAAGWDGIVIEGKASSPVWVNMVNDEVTFEDAGPGGDKLWGLDTWETQHEIWRIVAANQRFGEWREVGESYTTQRPAVVTIGPAGENLSRIASLMHDAADGAGQGGAGGVFGSKNLKAISVLGTGSVEVADPKALADARLWFARQHAYNVDNPLHQRTDPIALNSYHAGRGALFFEPNRITGCQACVNPCRRRHQSGTYNDSTCADFWYGAGRTPRAVLEATDLAHKHGVNTRDLKRIYYYLRDLGMLELIGPGKEIDSAPVPLDRLGTPEFAEALLRAISYREGIGADLADGVMRAAEKWGRLEEDLANGILQFPQWGNEKHYTAPDVEWGYGSIVGDRDINEHDFKFAWEVAFAERDRLSAERLVEILAEKVVPHTGDPFMFDYSEGETGIYSEHKAKLVAWHRHYNRFWKQSVLYCDWIWANFINPNTPDLIGYTPEGEPKFFNAVTGKNISFADGVEVGRRIWNLDRAIWILQGRHRDMEKFAEYVHKMPHFGIVPAYIDGEWSHEQRSVILDKTGVEEWKSHYYRLEGWDVNTGWPTRATLEGLGLGYVADELESKGKLGT